MPPDLARDLTPDTTRSAARRHLATVFEQAGLDSADVDARILVCAAVGIDHAGLVRDPDAPLREAAAALAGMAARRVAREPVSRILGRRAFWGLSLAVGPDVLDPRPETEGLVASILDALGGRRAQRIDILDLGTGSGAILAALLGELPGAFGIGVDRSAAACRNARHNLQAQGLAARSAIVCGGWADAIRWQFDVVVSNPPYIESAAIETLAPEVRDHDPRGALDGGADGLCAYRTIVPRTTALLAPGGIVGFECGAGQGAALAGLLDAAGLAGPSVYHDLAGHDRVVLAVRPDAALREVPGVGHQGVSCGGA